MTAAPIVVEGQGHRRQFRRRTGRARLCRRARCRRPARNVARVTTPARTRREDRPELPRRSTRRIRARISASRRWPPEQWKLGGGTVWGWISYDPETNLFFYGTGNPGVWNADLRPGRQQVVVRDLRARRRHRRSALGLPDHRARRVGLRRDHGEHARRHGLGGRTRKLLIHPGPHRLRVRARSRDRRAAVGRRRSSRSTGRAATTSRPASRTRTRRCGPHYGKVVTQDICPSSTGAKDFIPSAFSPRTGLLYIPRAQHLHGLRGHRGELHRRHAVPRRRA